MIVKKFSGKDYQEAIMKVKQEMGSDAIILQSREIKPRGLKRFITASYYEVTAVIDDDLKLQADQMKDESRVNEFKPKENEIEASELVNCEQELMQEMQKMQNLMKSIKSRIKDNELRSDSLNQYHETLISNNVNSDVASHITSQIEARIPANKSDDQKIVNAFYLKYLKEYLNVIQPIKINPQKKGNLVFLVGPTGVGKTTTIAKLAANMTFVNQKSVALVTLDTYRVAAVEQLRVFAEIMGIALSVVFTPQELRNALEKLMHNDVIFVDTAGRSPYNQEHMAELKECVTLAKPDEVILVMSATTNNNDAVKIFNSFNEVGIDKIIITKLDETAGWGQVLNLVYECKKPIAYVTNGQNVPDDIMVPDPSRLAAMLLENSRSI